MACLAGPFKFAYEIKKPFLNMLNNFLENTLFLKEFLDDNDLK